MTYNFTLRRGLFVYSSVYKIDVQIPYWFIDRQFNIT